MSPALRNASPRFISAPISAGERRGPGGDCTDPGAACGGVASPRGAGLAGALGSGISSGRNAGGGAGGGEAGPDCGLAEPPGGTAAAEGAARATGCDGPMLGVAEPGAGTDRPSGVFTSVILK